MAKTKSSKSSMLVVGLMGNEVYENGLTTHPGHFISKMLKIGTNCFCLDKILN